MTIPIFKKINPLLVVIKELLIVLIFILLILKLFSYKFKISQSESIVLFLFSYCLYLILHVFSYAPLFDILDDLRFQLSYILLVLCLFLFRLEFDEYLFGKLTKVFFISILFVLVISVFEYFDDRIIEILYGNSKDKMDNVRLSFGFRLISTMTNPINYAFYLLALIPVTYYLFYNHISHKLIMLSTFSLVLLGVLLSYSRLALIAFFVLMILYLCFELKRKFLSTFFILIVFVVLLSPMIVQFILENANTLERASELLGKDTYSSNARINNWYSAILQLDNPIFVIWGLGFGVSSPESSHSILVENAFISVLINFGVIGLLFYLASFFFFIRSGLLLWFRHNDYRSAFLIIGIFLILFVMGLGNDINRNHPFSFIFWIYLFFSVKMVDSKNNK